MTTNDLDREAVATISRGLQEGFEHPGDPEHDRPPTPVLVPFAPRPGQPPEMKKLMAGAVKTLSEAIVHALHQRAGIDFMSRKQTAVVRRKLGEGAGAPELIGIYCRTCDRDQERPLAMVTMSDAISIDGTMFLRALAKVDPQCPHGPLE